MFTVEYLYIYLFNKYLSCISYMPCSEDIARKTDMVIALWKFSPALQKNI